MNDDGDQMSMSESGGEWKAVHQFHSGSAYGDGVTNGMLFTQRLLRTLGYKSEIYVEHLAPELAEQIQSYDDFSDSKDALLLVHHSFGHDAEDWLVGLTCHKALIYHNITPAHFFDHDTDFYRYAVLGREQLQRWIKSDLFCGALGVLELNRQELLDYGFYRPLITLPLLIDLDLWRLSTSSSSAPVDDSSTAFGDDSLSSVDTATATTDSFQLLFVGRIARNKNQHLLVQLIRGLQRFSPGVDWQLNLVGGCSDGDYFEEIQQQIQRDGLEGRINLLGKVSHEVLVRQYRESDAFVCLSQHEGFGMPLIEAMFFSLPVLAVDSSNIAATLGAAGLLLEAQDNEESLLFNLQSLVQYLQGQPELLQSIADAGTQRLSPLEPELLQQQLQQWLQSLSL